LRGVLRVVLRVILRGVLKSILRSVVYDDLVIVIQRLVIRVNDSLIKCSTFSFSAKCLYDSARMLMERSIVNHECITGGIAPLDCSRLSRRLINDQIVSSMIEMIVVIFFIRGVNSNDDAIFAILNGRCDRRSTTAISGCVETDVVDCRSARNYCTLSVWYDCALTDHWVWLSNVRNDCFIIREIGESTVFTQ